MRAYHSAGPGSIPRARWLRGNARDSQSGGPGFKSRGRPTWLRKKKPVRVAQGIEAWPDSTRLVQRIAGSNPASGMDVYVRLCVCNLKQ